MRAPERCETCGDTGWKPVSRPDGSSAVQACGCQVGMRPPSRLDQIGVPPYFCERARFDYFDEISAPLRRAKQVVRKWADSYPDVKAGLLLSGPAGVGKTHLAVAALRHILFERGIAVTARFEYLPRLLREMQGAWKDPSLTEESRLAPVRRAEIVVLDQLGADMGSPRVEERLLYILNRCFHSGGFLICTTAYSQRPAAREAGLADQITVRAVSLLREACRFVEMPGEDYRDKVISPGLSV